MQMSKMAAKFVFFFILVASNVLALQLKQVLILGRHNARVPMTVNFEKVTPNIWPKWRENAAELTAKGVALESYFGEYFATWLQEKGLFDECPDKNAVFIHANNRQRTKETARVFAEFAFKNCSLPIYYEKSVTPDPIFNSVIRNTSNAFKTTTQMEMQKKLDGINIKDVLKELNRILDFNNSALCREESMCDLSNVKNKVYFKIGEQPDVDGPLTIGNSVVDALLMSFYNGDPFKEIGWGKLQENSRSYWSFLTQLTKQHLNVRFNTTSTARDCAEPLLQEMANLFSNTTIKFALLVGHDANLVPVLKALQFKDFELRGQYEKVPVGSKMVFQKWYDEDNDRFLLKIEYMYQTAEQLRGGVKLSKETPPSSLTMELERCSIDENGFCSWTQFIEIMQQF